MLAGACSRRMACICSRRSGRDVHRQDALPSNKHNSATSTSTQLTDQTIQMWATMQESDGFPPALLAARAINSTTWPVHVVRCVAHTVLLYCTSSWSAGDAAKTSCKQNKTTFAKSASCTRRSITGSHNQAKEVLPPLALQRSQGAVLPQSPDNPAAHTH